MFTMKTAVSHTAEEHPSYRLHRRQLWTQILLPLVLGVLLLMVAPLAMWLTRMGAGGDVGRWAAIATMWLLLPIMIIMLVLLAMLGATIFLASRVSVHLPIYGLRAQKFVEGVAGATRQGAEMVRKPMLALKSLGDVAKDRFKRLRERL